ncbi:MAG: TonB-dependent receptor [Bacteroidota bacterium]|nr:TonB-dependent receptor [Bacteroidota bacterium]
MKLKFLLLAILITNFTLTSFGQGITIKGTVVSNEDNKAAGVKKGEPLIGVTISVKGTTKGTVTDFDGNFELKDVPADATIVASYIGFATQEIKVSPSKESYSINMKTESVLIEEVVAIGYGRQKQADVTGAVSRVKESDMKQTINTSMDQAMQGRVAGVSVTNSSGNPGSPAVVNIRGIGSINGTQPLYVVDGVPLDYSSVVNINPNDIETMDVLKDASSAAIYGARGANGVIMITTKRGKEGKPKVEFEATYGVQEVWKRMDMLNANQYTSYMQDIYRPNFTKYGNDTTYTSKAGEQYFPGYSAPTVTGINGPVGDPSSYRSNTNWQDQILTTGKIENYNLGVRGGNQYATYSLSTGYFKNTGTTINTLYERYSIRANTDFTPKKWLKIGQSSTFSYNINQGGGSGLGSVLSNSPLIPVFDPQNNPGGWGAYQVRIYGNNNAPNPVAFNYQSQSKGQTMYFLSNAFTEIDFGNLIGVKAIEGLKYRVSVGAEIIGSRGSGISNPFVGFRGLIDDRVINSRNVGDSRSNNFNWLVDNILSYTKKYGKHEITGMVGMSSQYYYFSGLSGGTSYVPNGINTVLTPDNPSAATISGGDDQYALLGYLGRIQYGYNDKYLFTANIRYDGSSRFGSNNKYGIFPSFAAGWRISNESFMKNIQWISDLKLRYGYGQTGNQQYRLEQTGANFLYTQQIIPGIIRYPLGPSNALGNSSLYNGAAPTTGIANPDLRWETQEQHNIGVDLGLFQNKFQFNLDFFDKTSRGILIPAPIPSNSGITGYGDNTAIAKGGSVYYANYGSVNNRGFEFVFTYRNEKGKFKYSLSPNVTYVENKVLALEGKFGPGGAKIVDAGGNSITEPGKPMGYFYGYQTDGIIKDKATLDAYQDTLSTGKSVGDIKFKDINGDGKISQLDRTYLGKPFPTVTYGFTAEARYKGFDLRLFFQGVAGNQIYNSLRNTLESMNNSGSPPDDNQSASILNRWTPQNSNSTMPRYATGDPNNNGRFSSRFIEDGSYLRLKSVSLGYTLPEALLKKMFRSADAVNLRLFILAQNLLTFTNYKGYDPEIGSFNPTAAGFDGGTSPQPRTYSVGARIEF